jgi:branched-chain amino acid transport system substrate-binding protein
MTDDDQVNGMGAAALGSVTARYYSAAHGSRENEAFVTAIESA